MTTQPENAPTEYRITWEATSHYNFRGATDWWPLDDATPDEMQKDLLSGGEIPEGLAMAIEGSGFGWDVEFR